MINISNITETLTLTFNIKVFKKYIKKSNRTNAI